MCKGIGYETALDLARRRARVILACRDLNRGREAQKAISAATGNENVFVRQLDVSSFESVRAFVKVFVQEERQLHILINNAGIAAGM